jgi:hypothetical protein
MKWNSSREGGVESRIKCGIKSARRRVFVLTPLPDFVGTPLKGRISFSTQI